MFYRLSTKTVAINDLLVNGSAGKIKKVKYTKYKDGYIFFLQSNVSLTEENSASGQSTHVLSFSHCWNF